MSTTNTQPRERCGKYEIMLTLGGKRPNQIPVYIMAAVDADNPMRYQVRRMNSAIQFATYREAQDYCKQRGWVK